jgi:hypothetical protein
MFQIDQRPAYWWPVKVSIPLDGGKHETCTFDAKFKRLASEDIDALQKRALAERLSDAQIAAEVMEDFRDVVDRDGNCIPYTPAALKRLLSWPGMGTAVCDAYFGSLKPAAEKNS